MSGPVLVAGGAGFVGSALVRHLLDEGRRVVVYDDFFSGVPENVEGLDGDLRVVEADVLDEGVLEAVFSEERFEEVYDLVGDTFVPSAYDHPRRFFRINMEVCLHLLEATARHGVRRMLYVSSTEVYGRSDRQPLTEDAPLLPANTYAVSKVAADRLCHTFFHEHGVPVVIARIFNTYGPRETHPYVVPEIFRQLASGPVLRLGDVETRRDLTYVDDTARGLAALMASDLPDGEPTHVGSGTAIRIRDLAERCGRLFGHDHVVIETDPRRIRRREVDAFVCDASRLRAATGWAPTVDLDAGLERTFRWFEANGRRWSWEAWCPDGVNVHPRQSAGRRPVGRAAGR